MATAVGNSLIDPFRGAKFPIIINEQLLKDERPSKRQRISVQLNHRPKLSDHSTTTITSNHGKDTLNLCLKDAENGEFKYTGTQESASKMALFFDPSERAFILDKVDANFHFDLHSSLTQQDASSIYPQLDKKKPSEDDEDVDDETPNPDNPYDYRHFLNKGHQTPSPLPSHASSPIHHHTFNTSPALPTSSARPPKSTAPTKPPPAAASRPTPRPHSRPKQRTTPTKPRYLSPQLPPHRRQVTKPASKEASDSDSDSNALVIDMGDSAPTTADTKPWRSALRILNENTHNSTGPISLRSAASSMSPSIRGGSPSSEENNHNNNNEDDTDERKRSPAAKPRSQPPLRRNDSEEEEDGNESDADVDEIDLNPATAAATSRTDTDHPPPVEEAATPGNGWGDEDDDELEAELALALEEDQAKSDAEAVEAASRVVSGAESSEESEEE